MSETSSADLKATLTGLAAAAASFAKCPLDERPAVLQSGPLGPVLMFAASNFDGWQFRGGERA